MDVTATKVWDDADDQDGIRPASATLSLYADGVKKDDFVATATALSKTWADLPKNAAGREIAYDVREDAVPRGYAASIATNVLDFTVTNTHEPETVDISATKVWEDENDAEGLRPDSVTLVLCADGVEKARFATAGDNLSTTWPDLPKCAAGREIAYEVREASVPAGYSSTVTHVGSAWTITNTHSTGAPELKATATWALERSTGLIVGTFTLRNAGNKPFAADTDFWLATPGSRPTWYVHNRTGRMPDAADYYDFTAAVRAAVKKTGNRDAVLDPGESVTVSGLKMYHKSRHSPETYLDVQAATHAGRLFHATDANRDFVLSAAELAAAEAAWSAGASSDADLLEATRLRTGKAYLWNDAAGNWATLSRDKR